MFYKFFKDMFHIADIYQAFKNICLDKMRFEGYSDMSAYIYGRIKKENMYASLKTHKSKYAVLYQGPYPKLDTAHEVWRKKIEEPPYRDGRYPPELTFEESSAIVNWVYRMLKNAQEKEDFTEELLRQIRDLAGITNEAHFSKGVVYNAKKVEVHFLSSVSSVSNFISSVKKRNDALFFRGHANANYTLCPSIMRTTRLQQNESKLYHELLINCPDDFEKCGTHLEKLVKMQHYGLPTRLLDITRNLLVALYFACESNLETYGELVLISAENQAIKYPQSDTVSILASLPVFSYQKQQEFFDLACDTRISNIQFNDKAGRLIHEVRLEKPAFQADINKEDILNNYVVYALKNNSRIVKQDGAFILCGLSAGQGSLERFRYREHGKKIIVLLEKKKRILEQLENFSINRASLFPEIECVAEYLKTKYSS